MTPDDLARIEARAADVARNSAAMRPATAEEVCEDDVPALVAALREARAEVDHLTDLLADVNDSTGQWRRRYDALRDGVTGLHFRDARGGCASCVDPDGFSVWWPCETAAVVARVEGDES